MDNSVREKIPGMLPSLLETKRLHCRGMKKEEGAALQQLNEMADYIAPWVGGWTTPSDYAHRTLEEGNLPPGGIRDRFLVQGIFLRNAATLVGTLELYHGYPVWNNLSIGWLFIHPHHQRQGYAQELVLAVVAAARGYGYGSLSAGVSLMNWPALRFWVNQGFAQIDAVVGDAQFGPGASASVILRKILL